MPEKPGAQFWIECAEEARREAEAITDVRAKQLLLHIAENYAELAVVAASNNCEGS
jgi:hypothetical protein